MKHLAGLSPLFSSDAGQPPCERAYTQLMKIQKRNGSGQHFIVLVHGAQPPDRAFEQDVQHGKAVMFNPHISIPGGINGCGITPVSPCFTVCIAIPRIGKGQTAVQAEWGSY